jgi:Na+/melibiose symporter-like transporter
LRLINWSPAPADVTPVQRRNFLNVQIDAIGIGLASAAAPFLPVFLARLGATNSQIGLLSSMPGIAGLILALQIGSFLQRQRNVVPWFSRARLLVVSSYALTGIITIVLPAQYAVVGILAIWAIATVPQTVVNIAFSVVMSNVAGPRRRYDLMSRRWTVLGATTSISVAIIGQLISWIGFPRGFQVVFMLLSLGGLISFYFSSHIDLPDMQPRPSQSQTTKQRIDEYITRVRSNKPFVSFVSRRFIFLTGQSFATPLFPLLYVRVLKAPDSAIGLITTASTACALIGYALWVRQSRRRGPRFVLLCTTFALALYPAFASFNRSVEVMIALAALAGIFSAGLNLVFFDELMKTVPDEYSATFVSLAQMLAYSSAVAAPLISTSLANYVGIPGALLAGSCLTMLGFVLFLWNKDAIPVVQ